MRHSLFTVLLGIAACAALPAAAQNNNNNNNGTYTNWQQQQPVYAVPMYVAPNSQQMYSAQGANGIPVYNNNAQPLPVEQLVAGKNAPSYNFNNNAYTGFGSNSLANVSSIGSLSPEQASALRAQRDAQAAAYERDYLAQLTQSGTGGAASGGSSAYQGSAFSNLYTGNQDQTQKPPVKRRVVYNERNNPLTTPPRLFSID